MKLPRRLRKQMRHDWRPPRLETERLVLRPVEESDADAVFAYASNPAVTEYTIWETHRTMTDTVLFVRDYAISRYLEGVPDPLGIVLKEQPDRVVGSLGTFWASKQNAAMELGYVLAEPYWGRGYATEAARAVLDLAFREYPVERVQARCIAENAASARVMQKLGMAEEGTLRSAVLRRGRFWDVRYFSMLRREWEAR